MKNHAPGFKSTPKYIKISSYKIEFREYTPSNINGYSDDGIGLIAKDLLEDDLTD